MEYIILALCLIMLAILTVILLRKPKEPDTRALEESLRRMLTDLNSQITQENRALREEIDQKLDRQRDSLTALLIELRDTQQKTTAELSVRLAEIFNVYGMCRFDYIVRDDVIYFLEGNLVPSLATGGSYSHMLEVSGTDFNDFIADMISSFEHRVKNNKLFVYSAE